MIIYFNLIYKKLKTTPRERNRDFWEQNEKFGQSFIRKNGFPIQSAKSRTSLQKPKFVLYYFGFSVQ